MRRVRGFLIQNCDRLVAKFPKLEDLYLPFRAQIVLRKYHRRRERYATICRDRNLVYSEADTVDKVRKRLRKRGYIPRKRNLGEVHTFAFIPRQGWHENLCPDLYELGPVTEFDYVSLGFDDRRSQLPGPEGEALRFELNKRFLEELVNANRNRPVDWVYIYASGNHVLSSTLKRIQQELGMPVVNMCLDDKQSWEGKWLGEQRGLQIDIAGVFDLSWTSARVATGWYLAEGGLPIWMPEGCNVKAYFPLSIKQDIDVSFVGRNYGIRSSVVKFLSRAGIDVQAFGSGWDNGPVSNKKLVDIFRRSVINLGMGSIGVAEYLTNVKGRDFDVPCTGGGMYITSFNPDLALHFTFEREVIFYRGRDEMLELIRYYLERPDEAKEIARAGRERCLAEHRWLHRYVRICQILGILDETCSPSALVEQAGLSEVF